MPKLPEYTVKFFIFIAMVMFKLWSMRKSKNEQDSSFNFEKSGKIFALMHKWKELCRKINSTNTEYRQQCPLYARRWVSLFIGIFQFRDSPKRCFITYI